ncbi:MAG: type II secretion system major pseudopilin GspG [Giesbergeria sp.]|uniref:type II secretion system major pseudopilin GspG n=1 Tax=Giesbergeria sp. TaxID=2818473 RepID=UPI00261BA85C|nr:type II secretion system major pseudopilin GspG [Giesbergeria sp.]MDD2611133.1 type II secretion system major pseudopilin GspG [Giesbergeria sp.]
MILNYRAHFHPFLEGYPQGRFAVTKYKAERGFTLLELLVVMVIIGLLVGYVGPRYFAQIGKSEVKAALAQIDGFEKAVEQYRLDVGKFPSNEQGLNALFVRPATEPRWQGPYLKKMPPLDPWGNPYVYRTPGENGDFDIISLGKDGAPGGEGDAADVKK